MADTQYITSTLTSLVQTRSINPAFAEGEPSNEREIATRIGGMMPVSYTHLTLPTNREV